MEEKNAYQFPVDSDHAKCLKASLDIVVVL